MKISNTLLLGLGLASIAVAPAIAADWSYKGPTGPEHWGDLDPKYAMCAKGLMQSPIDLVDTNARGDVSVFTQYRPGPLTILNNGHTVQANFAEGSTLTSGTMQFNLLQVHFHTPSEEVKDGEQYPMVAHFVHADASGRLAVLGILFELGAANAELDKLIAAAPASKADARNVPGVTFNPNKLLPDDLDVYRFQGSLTTPPCSEGVNWHVAKDSVSMSAEQLKALHGIMGDNARPVQPLNGRLLVAPAG